MNPKVDITTDFKANKVGEYKNPTIYEKIGKWAFKYYSRSNAIFPPYDRGYITANANTIADLEDAIDENDRGI